MARVHFLKIDEATFSEVMPLCSSCASALADFVRESAYSPDISAEYSFLLNVKLVLVAPGITDSTFMHMGASSSRKAKVSMFKAAFEEE